MNSWNKPKNALSVGELSAILKQCFQNPNFQHLPVYGEVYSLKLGKFSYLEIGDPGIDQVKSPMLRVAFACYYHQDYGLEEIKVGDVVLVTGALSYYEHGSSVTLWGESIQVLQSQEGKTLLAKKKTLEKLDKLGLLDPSRKRKIPRFVKKVAILTAENGAAYQDILKTLHDRFPVSTVLYPVTVQGENAARSIVSALERVRQSDCDVVLLGRGGGGKSDLSCFDDEKVALAIAHSPIPVITCIGHTIDTSIADRVSDVQAITPTEGASLINPSKKEILEERETFASELKEEYLSVLRTKEQELASFEERLNALSPKGRLKTEREKKKSYLLSLTSLFKDHLHTEEKKKENLDLLFRGSFLAVLEKKKKEEREFAYSLELHDPSKLKEKGYSLLYKEGKLITSVTELKKGDKVTITYPDGRKEAVIL